jgi:hypothetical protein
VSTLPDLEPCPECGAEPYAASSRPGARKNMRECKPGCALVAARAAAAALLEAYDKSDHEDARQDAEDAAYEGAGP